MAHPFREAVEAKDVDAMLDLLAPDIRFRSPVVFKAYEGKETVSMLLGEQNAALALDLADDAYLIETGRLVTTGPARQLRDDENIRRSYLGY